MVRLLLVFGGLLGLVLGMPAAAPDQPAETVVTFHVKAMPAPRPALKYQLLPELIEMNPGNPIQGYLKCFMEQQNFFFNKDVVNDRERWQIAPLSELPIKQLHNYGGGALQQAHYAARLDTPDWQILLKAKSDGFRLLLPDVQYLRMLAGALKVRFRVQVAERNFDDAIATAKTMFALARHMTDHPTIISDLVGIAIATLGVGPLEEMVQQPGCPNLYWALSDLPEPLIDLRKGIQGERLLLEAEFAGFEQTTPISEDRLEKLRIKFIAFMREAEFKGAPKDWLEQQEKNTDYLRTARKRLVESGLPAEKVEEFPALQVVLLDQKNDYEARRDEILKWMGQHYWEAEARMMHSPVMQGLENTAFGSMVRPFLKVKKAQARIQQRIALLRHLEAIRLYAADHDGKLPATLDDIGLPLPVDPFSGKALIYKIDGETATLRGTPPKGDETTAVYNYRYVISIKK